MTDEGGDWPTTVDDILTAQEAAEILGKTLDATRALLRRGSMRGRRLGKPAVWVTTRHEVREYAAWARSHNHHERRRPASGRYLRSL
jgi:hypothetical protein